MTGSSGRPISSRSALAEAYEKAVKSEAEKKALRSCRPEEAFPHPGVPCWPRPGSSSPHAPSWWRFTRSGSAWARSSETTAERDANLRLTLYVAGQQLASVQEARGVYPDRLADAGSFTPGLAYVKTPDGGYTLKLSRGADRRHAHLERFAECLPESQSHAPRAAQGEVTMRPRNRQGLHPHRADDGRHDPGRARRRSRRCATSRSRTTGWQQRSAPRCRRSGSPASTTSPSTRCGPARRPPGVAPGGTGPLLSGAHPVHHAELHAGVGEPG